MREDYEVNGSCCITFSCPTHTIIMIELMTIDDVSMRRDEEAADRYGRERESMSHTVCKGRERGT